MPDEHQSIEDLISASQGEFSDEEGAPAKLNKHKQEIKTKEIERLIEEKAYILGVSYINLANFPISPDAISLISEEKARELKIICFYYDGTNVRIGATNLENEQVQETAVNLAKEHFSTLGLYLISENSFNNAVKLYKNLPQIIKIEGVEIKEEDLDRFQEEISDYKVLAKKIDEVNISDIVTLILATAIKTKSSDVHIEAEEDGIAVRFRIDGVLQKAAYIKKEKWRQIVSRMKLLAKVKINVNDKAQDGRFTIYLHNEKIEVRVSFLPTSYGESVVMRILRPDTVGLPFSQLGLSQEALVILEKEIKKPNGLILTTGPTGSGKTTTLYSILNQLNSPTNKIITIEDPIEYRLEGINQSQVGKNYTFAKALRSIVRQDPDIIMVGEIRDLDTAEVSVEASLTGHLVLSTLHTNDASGVIPRLIEMGVKSYFLTPSINAVIGQRLVRKLCDHCKIKHDLSQQEREQVKKIFSVISPKAGIDIPLEYSSFYKAGPGCEHCSGIGYKGRIGIYEIFTITEKLKELISDNTPAFKILQEAIEEGMITMLQDGLLKSLAGITSLEEVYRVIGKFEYIDNLYDIVISKTLGRGIKISSEDLKIGEDFSKDLIGINEKISQIPSGKVLKIIIAAALKSNAGDVHIEPAEKNVKIRFRIDGILHDIASLSKEFYLPLISEIKTLSGFPTNIKQASWDGRFSISTDLENVDSRVSIISGGYGETVVIRILATQAKALKIENLGMRSYSLKKLNSSISKTKGIIITTGPTGSGKTTSLYSILNQLNKSDIKIITIEDPIEYHLDGVMQTQINQAEGYTFTLSMKSLLRQNPNIIMIGEIRDSETAKIAIEAAMTGHLVLSTIHANNAAGAVSRFVGLGVERQLLASAIECSIGQRLVRKLCPKCKQETELEPEILFKVKEILNGINPAAEVEIPTELKFYKGMGCEYCGGIGYKDRVGIYEVIKMDPDLNKIIQKAGITDFDIEQAAMEKGTVLMIQDGILKALDGETSVAEVFRVAD